jgi:hypothetical protein
MMPGADSLNTHIINTSIIPEGFHPGMFESLDDSAGNLYDSLILANARLAQTVPTADTLFYMPATTRSELLQSAYGGAVIEIWSAVIFLFILMLLVSIQVTNNKYLKLLIQSNFNLTIARRLFGERVYSIIHESLRADLVFILTMGFLVFHALFLLDIAEGINRTGLYLISSLGVLTWLMLKLALYRISSKIFQSEESTNEYLFYHQTGTRVSGLFLAPLVFVLFFTKGDTDNILLITALIMLTLLSFQTLIRGFGIIRKKVFSIYYPILYLCTLEISPLIVAGLLLMRLK